MTTTTDENKYKLPTMTIGIKILIGFTAFAFILALVRYIWGIGAVSNLNDSYPWGIWISFDLLCGVALAAGAFTTAATVHIFNIKKYEPLVRPAILTGFLGYTLVVIALLVDLGRPERIWHLIVYWNTTSIMFEVGWCVMLYLTVLFLEFSPSLFKRWNWNIPLKLVHSISIILIIAGVVLSTLHQSSLGSMFIIMKAKLHPLWHTSYLPVLFFLSAVAVGPAMVVFESYFAKKFVDHAPDFSLLSGISRIIPYVLITYFIAKVGELIYAGEASLMFTAGKYSVFFWIEIIIGVIIPTALLLQKKIREDQKKLLIAVSFVIFGLIINRFNVSLLGFTFRGTGSYVPHIFEVILTLGIWSAGILVYWFLMKNFVLLEQDDNH